MQQAAVGFICFVLLAMSKYITAIGLGPLNLADVPSQWTGIARSARLSKFPD